MTLNEIRAAFPDLFYRHGHPDEWFSGEKFMDAEPRPVSPYFQVSTARLDDPVYPVQAVDLAALYVKDPDASVWKKFLHTDDTDRFGNRVYVGGVGHNGCSGFQIHRHHNPPCWWVYFA